MSFYTQIQKTASVQLEKGADISVTHLSFINLIHPFVYVAVFSQEGCEQLLQRALTCSLVIT